MQSSPYLDFIATTMFERHYAKRTIESYVKWIRSFINFHSQRHPLQMGENEVLAFLNYLAVQKKHSSSTQSNALNALVFLYKEIIDQSLSLDMKYIRSNRPQKLPVVLTALEVQSLLALVSPTYKLPVSIMYGSGLRLMECTRLRVADLANPAYSGVWLPNRLRQKYPNAPESLNW